MSLIPPENLEDIAKKFGFGKYAKEKRMVTPAVETLKKKYLYIATIKPVRNDNTLWRLQVETKKLEKIADKKKAVIWGLCSYNGKLYYGGSDNKIFEKTNNPEEPKQIATRTNRILTICSHDEKLYDGGEYGICETIENPEQQTPIKTGITVITLCSHNGKLYYGNSYGIFQITLNASINILNMFSFDSFSLCNHQGDIYSGTGGEKIYILSPTGKSVIQIIERKGAINSLCSHDGKLYDGGHYEELYDTLDNKIIATFKDEAITALASHEEEK